MDRDDLVVLRKFSQLHEAELAISALEAAHIDAILRDTAYGGFRPEASIVGGGVTVMVRRDQIEAANEVLDAPALQEPAADSVICANCGRSVRGIVCDACEMEDQPTYMTPANTRLAIDKVRVLIVVVTLGVIFLPAIIERLKGVDERRWLMAFAIVAGALLVVVLFKALVTSNDERL